MASVFAALLVVQCGLAPLFGDAELWAAVATFLGLRGVLQGWWLRRVVEGIQGGPGLTKETVV